MKVLRWENECANVIELLSVLTIYISILSWKYSKYSRIEFIINLQVVKLPEDVYPTDMHWFPKGLGGGKKAAGSDVFALCSTDGIWDLMLSHVDQVKTNTNTKYPFSSAFIWWHCENNVVHLVFIVLTMQYSYFEKILFFGSNEIYLLFCR